MAEPDNIERSDELRRTVRWRYEQARIAGLTKLEAELFAESEADLEQLRQLADHGCAPATIAKIVL